ncbi:hypothetical protein BACCIP111895_00841 [Neobacillus rhizosphaerae]|uniref:CAAX prenyl protease 2/Lysostaphin resistance protein A-like domain-containing protein n=1 Tax=Neobacillus rhizosphaerae TaxID=2880965 RepID=A0ABN8KKN0_9BACI|nr:CPBP family intramembrane glutamic endopeptidase [Neobacillus rhizosphaerae]CAH2713687.1 hypothetical protein BACCIP111895_00841 [Neobacillus rhizosphaerae]
MRLFISFPSPSPSPSLIKDRPSVIMDTLILLFLPLMFVSISGLLLLFSFPNITSEIFSLFIVAISMTSGFCLIPYLYLKIRYRVSLVDIGIKAMSKYDIILMLVVMAFVSSYLLYIGQTTSYIILNGIQMLIVATTEEFWARGAICFLLFKLTKSHWLVIILSSIFFAFFTHLNEPFIENILYRLPGSFVMGIIFVKTRNLLYTILFHFLYNMIMI